MIGTMEIDENRVSTFSFFAMGTRCDAVLFGADDELALFLERKLLNIVQKTEALLSRYDQDSPVSDINLIAGKQAVEVPEKLWNILQRCNSYYAATDGAFDITMSPLINYWKSISDDNIANQDIYKDIHALCGFDKIKLDEKNKSIRFARKGMAIDFGGIGKGIALEEMRAELITNNIKNAIISFGESSVMALGHHPEGEYWPLGLQHAYLTGENLHVFECVDTSLTTSSNVLNSSGEARLNPHIINPITGTAMLMPTTVSVKVDSAEIGEVISTACMFLSESKYSSLRVLGQEFELVKIKYLEDDTKSSYEDMDSKNIKLEKQHFNF